MPQGKSARGGQSVGSVARAEGEERVEPGDLRAGCAQVAGGPDDRGFLGRNEFWGVTVFLRVFECVDEGHK